MNKKALLDYALFARKELETQIALGLNKLGIYKDRVLKSNVVGDYTIIEGNPDSLPKRVYSLRRTMLSQHFENGEKFDTVVEEFAYTWFNRIVAIRFMEVHDYFSHGFRVLTSRDGSYEPEILSNLPYVANELKLEEDVVRSLKDQNKTEELYRYVFVKQCAALSKVIPDIFDGAESYLELLLPNNLLSQDSVIRKIELIPEEDFMNDVEVVGWLYQFYNSIKKDEVFASKETITKDTLPAVTQLFTPDWIVRYMAENSVGRLWLESYPDSSLKQSLKYYVEDAKQDEETQKKLDGIKYKNVNPEEIKIIEPCCGSGHILVYVFDLLLSMYLEKGYNKRDIPGLILKNNLYGLDVDKRAAQLAKFSLIMKARSIDNRFFNEDRFVNPRVYEIKDSQLLIALNYKDAMKSLHFSAKSIELAEYLVNTFEHGKVIGSLLKVVGKDYTPLIDDIKRCKETENPGLFEQDFYNQGLRRLRYLARVARVLARKYDVMITNPPYVNLNNLEELMKKYANKNYLNAKSDMFSMFIWHSFEVIKENGFTAFMTPYVWMFIKSYNELREHILRNKHIVTLAQLEYSALEEAIVPLCTFTCRNSDLDFNGTYFRLTDFKGGMTVQNQKFLEAVNNVACDYVYMKHNKSLLSIPAQTISYWISDKLINILSTAPALSPVCKPTQGMATGDNGKFVRYWWEPSFVDEYLNSNSREESIKANKKFVPYNKGGLFRKWYGNNDCVVYFKDFGKAIAESYGSRFQNSPQYLIESISWSKISSGNIAFRYKPFGHVFDVAGCSIFGNHDKLIYLIGVVNSNVIQQILKATAPTLNYEVGQIAALPIIYNKEDEIRQLAQSNIDISKNEWDSYEDSWNFLIHPLVSFRSSKIADSLLSWKNKNEEMFSSMKRNEETINSIVAEMYGLTDEVDSTVLDKNVSIRKVDTTTSIKSLVSYFIGCLMGRYSLEHEGLIYAGGEFDSSRYGEYVDEDGILPIYPFIGINDGLTQSICKLVKRVYGDTYYRENINFIADALGRKTDEGAEEAINRYLNDEFYKDHLKVYQNRPIYWMFNSGKQGAFKCLVYLHRYDRNTLAKINAKYFLPRTAMYKTERERLVDQLSRADIAQRKKIDAQLKQIEAAEEELQIYGQVLDHMANQYIDIDLDDGVKVNYVKFQGVSIQANGATIKKDLLVPFGLEKKK